MSYAPKITGVVPVLYPKSLADLIFPEPKRLTLIFTVSIAVSGLNTPKFMVAGYTFNSAKLYFVSPLTKEKSFLNPIILTGLMDDAGTDHVAKHAIFVTASVFHSNRISLLHLMDAVACNWVHANDSGEYGIGVGVGSGVGVGVGVIGLPQPTFKVSPEIFKYALPSSVPMSSPSFPNTLPVGDPCDEIVLDINQDIII